jgi:hypothetical protein
MKSPTASETGSIDLREPHSVIEDDGSTAHKPGIHVDSDGVRVVWPTRRYCVKHVRVTICRESGGTRAVIVLTGPAKTDTAVLSVELKEKSE